MAGTKKVFIYDGRGTDPDSVADLYALFTSTAVFPGNPDVKQSDFKSNLDGLKDPIFVIPGGSTTSIGYGLMSEIERIKSPSHYGYVGFCAGANLGVHNAELFNTRHVRIDDNNFTPAEYLWSTTTAGQSLNIFEDCEASGAFYPDNSHINSAPKNLMPYCVNINFNSTNAQLSQLYVGGSALFPVKKSFSDTEVVATYSNSHKFTLFGTQKNQEHPLAAVVRRKADGNQGGKLLSATHLETCVNESRVLNFFKEEGMSNGVLNAQQRSLMEEEQENTRKVVENLLRETLNPC